MSEEASYIQAILAAPQDDGPRLAYADWLEQRADSRAEFLRTQILLASLRPKDPRRAVVMHLLRDLRRGLDAAWLASVDRPPIENCGLEFRFECPRQWEALRHTENAAVRFCDACERRVYYCQTVGEARSLARLGECVAVDTTLVRRPGDINPPPTPDPQRPGAGVTRLGVIRIAPPPPPCSEGEGQGDWKHRQRHGRRAGNRRRPEMETED
jgi:uncharacterized protein (TIGR02996 family)